MMKHILDISKYSLYSYKNDKDLIIAVPHEYDEQIKLMKEEFGSLEKVPTDKTVRGIYVKKNSNKELEMLTATEQQNDITVNQLKPLE